LEERTPLIVESDQIGEGAADINRHKDHSDAPNAIALVFSRWRRSAN
jgi:hypothetical protein